MKQQHHLTSAALIQFGLSKMGAKQCLKRPAGKKAAAKRKKPVVRFACKLQRSCPRSGAQPCEIAKALAACVKLLCARLRKHRGTRERLPQPQQIMIKKL